jgi:hypothetical protein
MSVNVIDLRGQGGHTGGASVLADPSGRRHRALTAMGRIVASVLVVWLCGLVVAGLGLLPAPIVPFASFVGAQSSPPRLARLPAPRPPSGSDLRLAAPASRPVSGAHANHAPGAAGVRIDHRDAQGGRSRDGHRPASPQPVRGGFDSPTKPKLAPMRNTPGQSIAGAPLQSGTTEVPVAAPVPSGAGGTGTTSGSGTAESSGEAERPETPGKSESAPGRSSETTTTPTTPSAGLPGASGSAPGHAEAHSHEQTAPAPTG